MPKRQHTPDVDVNGDSLRDLVETATLEQLRDAFIAVADCNDMSRMSAISLLAEPEVKRHSPAWNADAAFKPRVDALTKDGYYLVCKGCKRTFHPADNAVGSCSYFRYHPDEVKHMDFRKGCNLGYPCCGQQLGGNQEMKAILLEAGRPVIPEHRERGGEELRHIADPHIDLREANEVNPGVSHTGSKRRRVSN